MKNLILNILTPFAWAIILTFSVFAFQGVFAPLQAEATVITPIAGKTYSLFGGGVNSTQTQIRVVDFTYPATTTEIATSHLGDVMYGVLEPGSPTRQEIISFTGVTPNSDNTVTLTGVTRGLKPYFPYTEDSTLKKSHPGGSNFVLSNPPQLYYQIIEYINDAVFAGASDASTIVKGLVELATTLETAAGTASGSSGPLAIANSSATSSGQTTGSNLVVVTGTDGNIDDEFLPDTIDKSFTFSATTTFTGYVDGVSSSSIKSYTASTTYTKPANLRHVVVKMVGGGGGGGGASSARGGGGGAGAYVEKLIPASSLATTTTITIGAGGTPGTASSDGGSGGTTSFGSHFSAAGGSGGREDSNGSSGGSGGVASGGDINISGGSGQGGKSGSTDDYIGWGGSSFMGTGYPAVGYGYGGRGGQSGNGAEGASGYVVVIEYF